MIFVDFFFRSLSGEQDKSNTLSVEQVLLEDKMKKMKWENSAKKKQRKIPSEFDDGNLVYQQMFMIAEISLIKEDEPELIILYRYLGLKHRAMNPMREENQHLTPKLEIYLDKAICESCHRFFTIVSD